MSIRGVDSWWAIAMGLLLLFLVACNDNLGKGDEHNATPTPTVTPNPTPEPVYDVEEARAELAAARALWESKGSEDSTIDYVAFYLSRVPMRLTVRNGVIESAEFLEGRDSGMPVPPEDMHAVRTIDGLFDKIEEALSGRPAWNVGAEYDAELSYPREFGVSYTDTPDDYFAASICCYKPLDSSPPPATSTHSLDMESRHASVLDL